MKKTLKSLKNMKEHEENMKKHLKHMEKNFEKKAWKIAFPPMEKKTEKTAMNPKSETF